MKTKITLCKFPSPYSSLSSIRQRIIGHSALIYGENLKGLHRKNIIERHSALIYSYFKGYPQKKYHSALIYDEILKGFHRKNIIEGHSSLIYSEILKGLHRKKYHRAA